MPMRSVTLRGVVRSAERNLPLQMVRVELHKFGGEPISVTFTDGEGAFTFFDVSLDSYQISINQDGYEPVEQTVQFSGQMDVAGLMIFLRELPGHLPSAPGSVISAQELALPAKVKKDYNKGLSALYEKHKPEVSLPFFARVIAQAPAFYPAYHQSGVAYQRLGRNQEAEVALRKALELSKGHDGPTQTALASVLLAFNRCTEAETFAREGLAVSQESWLANYEFARTLVCLRRMDEAEKIIRDTLRLNPDLPQAFLLLTSVHMSRRDGVSLIKDLDNFLRLDPKGPQSDWARKKREQIRKDLAEAKVAGTPAAPHP